MEPTPELKAALVEGILKHQGLIRACDAMGIPVRGVYDWRKEDRAFDEDVKTAIELARAGGGYEMEDIAVPVDTAEPASPVIPQTELEALRARVQALEEQVAMQLLPEAVVAALAQARQVLLTEYAPRRNTYHSLERAQGSSQGLWTQILDAFLEDVS